jgi:hypothetical protein
MNRNKYKQILIKRIFYHDNSFDFMLKDEKDALHIIEHTKGENGKDVRFVKATFFEKFAYNTRKFFREKIKEIIFSIILIALTLLGQYIYDKWIKP